MHTHTFNKNERYMHFKCSGIIFIFKSDFIFQVLGTMVLDEVELGGTER